MEFLFAWLAFYFWWKGRRPSGPQPLVGEVIPADGHRWAITVVEGRMRTVHEVSADTEMLAIRAILAKGVPPAAIRAVVKQSPTPP